MRLQRALKSRLDARVTSTMPSPAENNSAPEAGDRRTSWLETVGVLAVALIIVVVGNVAGEVACLVLDGVTGMSTPQALGPGALETYTAARLAAFLVVFQVTVLVASLFAGRLFRRDRVAFMALLHSKRWVAGALPYAAILVLGAAIYAAVILLINRNALLGDILLLSDMMRTDAWWMIAFAAVIGAPVAEEFLFRGLMYGVLRTSPLGMVAAGAITAVLWASVHAQYSIYGIFGIALIGLYLAWVREKTGSLVAPIVCHAVYNGCVLAVMLLVPEHYMQMS